MSIVRTEITTRVVYGQPFVVHRDIRESGLKSAETKREMKGGQYKTAKINHCGIDLRATTSIVQTRRDVGYIIFTYILYNNDNNNIDISDKSTRFNNKWERSRVREESLNDHADITLPPVRIYSIKSKLVLRRATEPTDFEAPTFVFTSMTLITQFIRNT